MALYQFLTGKIRVLERDLLNKTDIDRMVDAPDFESAFSALNDTDYANHLLEVEPSQFKQALDAETKNVRDLMVQWIEDDALLEFMFLKFDAHNIKLYLKAKQNPLENAVERADEFASAAGLTDSASIKKTIVDEASDVVLHVTTQQLLTTVMEKLGSEPTGFEIDSVVDLVLYQLMEERMKKLKSRLIQRLFEIQQETAWVKTFVRAKLLETPAAEIQKFLPDTFMKHYDLDLEQAAEQLPISPMTREAFKNYIEYKRLWEFEKELEEAEIMIIRDAKYATSGPTPAVGYYYAKENAVRNLRLILTAKMNGIPAEEIKPRVRELY